MQSGRNWISLYSGIPAGSGWPDRISVYILSTQRIWQQVLRSQVQVQVRVLKPQVRVQVQVLRPQVQVQVQVQVLQN